MSIKSILVKILPIFFQLATRLWYSLSGEQRTAATRAVKFVQAIRNNSKETPAQVKQSLSLAFGIPLTTVDAGLTAIGIALGGNMSPNDVIYYLQNAEQGIEDEITRSRAYKTAAEAWAQYENPDKFDWRTFALGVIQIAFEIAFKGGVKKN
jgi:hypothetical protein